MNIPTKRATARGLVGLVALGLLGVTGAAPAAAQTSAVAGQGVAAAVTTLGLSQQFAAATLPSPDGFATNSADAAAVANTLSASYLTSITTGMADAAKSSAQTTAEAANINILNGLITAQQVAAVASSYASGTAAGSDGAGSTVLGLVVAGTSIGDALPAPNTQIALPGVGYVILNEQTVTGDGATISGITVNLIHVVLLDALTGAKTGEIIVGSATSQAAL